MTVGASVARAADGADVVRVVRPLLVGLVSALVLSTVPAAATAQTDGAPLRDRVAAQGDPDPPVVLRGRGWGHSVGMSQYGAYAQAREGRSHSQILQTYYPGTALRTWGGSRQVTVRLATGNVAVTPVEAIGGPITWRICQPDGTCRQATQAAGPSNTWTVRSGGASAPSRVRLQRADGSDEYAGNGTLEVRMTPRPDEVAPAGTRIRTYNPTGQRQYAYGWMRYGATNGGLTITNLLPLESYVWGIAEVPSGWGTSGGQAALEAQAIIARGYVLGRGLDTCATPACQVFNGYDKELEASGDRWVAAVTAPEVADRYLVDDRGAVATTYYSSSHGGRTEASEDSWAFGGVVPYLRSLDDPWSLDPLNPMRSWTTTASNAEFRRVAGGGLSRVQRVEILDRTDGGSPRTLRVHGPEGAREFTTTPSGARTARTCNRSGYVGNSLRCDLRGTVRNAAGQPFAGAGGQPPSSQIRSIGFAPFVDDDGNTHEYAIVWANAAGIAQGVSATEYAPRRAVTRGQMASFLYRTFDVPAVTTSPFRDAQDGPHAEAISSVSAAGIARGYDGTTFGTGDPVTREQMASFLVRALGVPPVAGGFRDVPPEGVHAGAVGALAGLGVTQGCGGDRFCPRDPVTRDQMASFLHRAVRSR
jgi:SpoIID/LytB domain protein